MEQAIDEKMYLSDYLREKVKLDLKGLGNKTCIISGVGSGKNHWVEEVLTNSGNVLLITSRRAKKDETVLDTIFEGKLTKSNLQRNVVYTNSGIEYFIKHLPIDGACDTLVNYFDYIVVDEAHSIVSDSTFSDAPFHLYTFIKKMSEKMKVILMTGTAKPINHFLVEEGWHIIDCMQECKNKKPMKIRIEKREDILKKVQLGIINDERTVYLANSAQGICNKLYPKIISDEKIKPESLAFCMSDDAVEKNKLIEKMPSEFEILKETYESIVNHKRLLDKTKLLLTTSRLKEGINIKDSSIRDIYCESHIATDIIQFAGRFRDGEQTLHIVKDAKQNTNYKILEIDYLFSKENGLKACNDFLANIEADESDDIQDDFGYTLSKAATNGTIAEFVAFIERRFEYIRYNHIENKFEIYELKHTAVEQANEDLKSFNKNAQRYLCSIFDIEDTLDIAKMGEDFLVKNAEDIAERFYLQEIQFFTDKIISADAEYDKKGKELLFKIFEKALNIDKANEEKINVEMKNRNIPYFIKNKKVRSGINKDKKVYYMEQIEN